MRITIIILSLFLFLISQTVNGMGFCLYISLIGGAFLIFCYYNETKFLNYKISSLTAIANNFNSPYSPVIAAHKENTISKILLNLTPILSCCFEDFENVNLECEKLYFQITFNQAIIESIANGIIITNADGKITRLNTPIEKNLYIEREKIIGSYIWGIFESWNEMDVKELIMNVLQNGKTYNENKIRYALSTDLDKYVIFNVKTQPIVASIWQGHKIIGTIILMEFLTDKIILEEHLLKVNEELLKTNEKLQQINIELQLANDAKTDFLSIVAHEIKSPLAVVQMYCNMLLEEKFSKIDEKQIKSIETINRRSKGLQTMVENLLDISMIESGKMFLKLDTVDLSKIINNSMSNFENLAAERGVTIQFLEGNKPNYVSGDSEKLQQIVDNLLYNAVKFTKGNTKIEITASSKKVDINSINNYDCIVIGISDQGEGIPLNEQDKIFGKFYQIDDGLNKHRRGNGLGLAIVKELAELHGGKVWVDSVVGNGSVFYFAIPKPNKSEKKL